MTPSASSGKKEGGAKGGARSSGRSPRRRPRATPKRAGGKSKSSPGISRFLLPILAVWILVVVALAGLIFWGESSKSLAPKKGHSNHSSPKQIAEPAKPAASKDVSRREPAPSSPRAEASHESVVAEKHPPAVQEHGTPSEPPRPAAPESNHKDNHSSLALSSLESKPEKGPPAPQPQVPSPKVARIAIVIDDFGLDLEMARKFLSIPVPLTFSILPYQPHTREIMQLAHSHGHEVILHVPMEPLGYPKVEPGPGALLLSMSSQKIKESLQDVLDANPHVSGINNHMGSRFTENKKAMRIVLNELQRRRLFFLDSFTSPHSVGLSLARELHVPSLRRDIFLDNTETEESISSQVGELIRRAKVQGAAVGIGHPHEITFRVLSEEANRFEKEGIAVVSIGELIGNSASR